MKRTIATLGLVIAAAALSGCYYDPGYSYVRSGGYQGDVYYGRSAPVYDDGYYAPGYYDYYGCCYAPGVSVGMGRAWYGGARYRPDYRGGGRGGHAYGGDRRPAYRGDDRGDRRGGHAGSDRQGQDGSRRHRDRDHRQ